MGHMFLAKLKECGAHEIDSEQSDRWAEECVRFLERNPQKDSSYVTSGPRAVIVFRDNDFGQEHQYEVFDCRVDRYDSVKVNENGYIVNTFHRETK